MQKFEEKDYVKKNKSDDRVIFTIQREWGFLAKAMLRIGVVAYVRRTPIPTPIRLFKLENPVY